MKTIYGEIKSFYDLFESGRTNGETGPFLKEEFECKICHDKIWVCAGWMEEEFRELKEHVELHKFLRSLNGKI